MRSDPRLTVLAALVMMLALGAPISAHADKGSPDPVATQTPTEQAPAADEVAADPPASAEPGDTDPAEEPVEGPADEDPPVSPPADEPGDDPLSPQPTEPTTGPDEGDDSAAVTVDNARLRWSLNALLHRAPHYGKNFLSAGVLADTAGGEMPASRWKQAEGAVRIERAAAASYVPATWDGFGTGVDHQVVIDGGTGTVDTAARTARVAWKGAFGVARYSGMTGFSVSDPVLVVENGVGRLEASLSGFGVSRDGNGAGNASGPIGPTTVVLADLGQVDLSNPAGLTMAPAFYGVQGIHSAQRADDQGRWGSFPASFISFVDQVGQAPFWMTSGSDDDHKPGSPVSVSFDAAAPLAATPSPVAREVKKPTVTNPVRKAPSKPTPAAVPVQPVVVPPGALPLTAPSATAPVAVAVSSTASLTAATRPVLVGPDGGSDLGWWIAVTFLLMSAAAVAAPSLLVRPRFL